MGGSSNGGKLYFVWLGSLWHLPWTRGRFRRARVIRDSSARKNDEEREERSVHQRTKHQNGACRDHGHFFRSRLPDFSAAPSVSGTYYTCAYDLSCLFPAVSYCVSDEYIAIRFYVTQARAKRHGRITLWSWGFYGKITREWKRKKKRPTTRVPKDRF